jgi:putative pyruvate formate lyase activating enzyme
MNQYWPAFRANDFPPLDRRVTQAEFMQAMSWAHTAGLNNFH